MNHSIHSADRSTHLKIVVVALVAGIAVAAFGISARTNADFTQTAQHPRRSKPASRWSSPARMSRRFAKATLVSTKYITAAFGRLFVGRVLGSCVGWTWR